MCVAGVRCVFCVYVYGNMYVVYDFVCMLIYCRGGDVSVCVCVVHVCLVWECVYVCIMYVHV